MPALDVQACRDRSDEFSAVLRALRERQQPAAPAPARPAALRRHGEFMAVAKLIGRDIAQTYSKLEKLTLLAQRRSLYEDRPLEVEQLTHIIKQDLASLNRQLLQLQKLSRTPEGGRGVQSFSSNVVVTLQQKLANMSTQFKGVLEVRTENLRRQRSRREQFSRGGVSGSLPPSALSGFHQGSVLLADEAAARGDIVLDMEQQQQQGQLLLWQGQDSYYQSRSETMRDIESTVVELGAIFQQLAHMVKEQEEMVQRIDANVDDASMNVEAAHTEILRYFQSVTSNRWLMIKVFGVLVTFFIVFVMFLT